MSGAVARLRNRLGTVAVDVADSDTMRWWTYVAVGGSLLAVVLSWIGGLPFDIPMPTHIVGWVEPTCGLTRGTTAVARGDLGLAWRYNPAVFLVVISGALGVGRAAVGLATGRWLTVEARPRAAGWIVLGVLVLLLWWHQQSNASFVINARR